jgi:hypothetical protein
VNKPEKKAIAAGSRFHGRESSLMTDADSDERVGNEDYEAMESVDV